MPEIQRDHALSVFQPQLLPTIRCVLAGQGVLVEPVFFAQLLGVAIDFCDPVGPVPFGFVELGFDFIQVFHDRSESQRLFIVALIPWHRLYPRLVGIVGRLGAFGGWLGIATRLRFGLKGIWNRGISERIGGGRHRRALWGPAGRWGFCFVGLSWRGRAVGLRLLGGDRRRVTNDEDRNARQGHRPREPKDGDSKHHQKLP